MSQQTVTINGTVYDVRTGMPVGKAEPQVLQPHKTSSRPIHDSHAIHQMTQKSQTLNRQIVKKTGAPAGTSRPMVQKSPSISKFAPHPSGAKPQTRAAMSDIGPSTHPMVAKAHLQQNNAASTTQKSAPKPSSVIKQEAINDAMEKAPSHNKREKRAKRHPRALSIASASFALLLLGGYFTYLNMPSLSVRVAAAQSGVNATYPEYRPDGYSLHGPVAYNENEVMMKFAANAGPQNFTVTQAKSNWDSSAVLDNYVKQKAGDNYITYNERGLTIYTFDGNAAWVNGGILYTVNGDAPLSTDQIRRIATSM
ncbi:MAG TPA: hypothetical protein VK502_01830 [Candidatus Saccharimonadales bacterium]|nr:hypothetical protein [Candidatus Saccharimonadales bacterium]